MNKELIKAGAKLIVSLASIFVTAKNAGKNGEKVAQSFIDIKNNLKH